MKYLIAILMLCLSTLSSASNLTLVDAFRMPTQNPEQFIDMQIEYTSYVNGVEKSASTSLYQIYLNPDNTAFVRYLNTHNKNKGARVLMKDAGIWFSSKNSSRAIRITPLQKATGDVSYGDIAKIRWGDDYQIEQEVPDVTLNSRLFQSLAGEPQGSFIKLALKSTNKTTSYKKIDLYTKQNYQPVYAQLYLASGKLFKVMWFADPQKDDQGRKFIQRIVFADVLKTGQHTQAVIKQVEFKDNIPARYFNQSSFMRGQ